MEQGNCLDSTTVSAAQDVHDDVGGDRALDAGIAALLTAPSASTPGAAPDPILAAIAETRRLYAAWTAALKLPPPADSLDPHSEVEVAATTFHAYVDNVLLETVPATAAGCAALASFAVEFLKTEGFSSAKYATPPSQPDNVLCKALEHLAGC